jgi:hypothetical protein
MQKKYHEELPYFSSEEKQYFYNYFERLSFLLLLLCITSWGVAIATLLCISVQVKRLLKLAIASSLKTMGLI